MRRMPMWILTLLVMAALGLGRAAPAAAQGPGTQPAAAAATTGPAATQPAGTAQEAGQDDSDQAVPKALIEAAKASFVVVKIWYKKDLSEPAAALGDNWRVRQIYEEFVDSKCPDERPGLVLDDKGHVLIYDDGLEERFLDRIEVTDVRGQTFPAVREKLLFGSSGVLLKVGPEAAGKLSTLRFAAFQDEGVNSKLTQAALHKCDEEWRIHFGPLQPAVRYGPQEPGNVYYGYRLDARYDSRLGAAAADSSPVIVADEDGRPVGCCVDSFMDLRQEECLWKGPDLLKAGGIAFSRLKSAEDELREKLTPAVHEVVIAFHQGGGGESYGPSLPSLPPFLRVAAQPRVEAGREITAYGVAISPTEVLVPMRLSSKVAAEIETISLKFTPFRRTPVEFVGAFKDFGAFLVRLPKGSLSAHVALARSDLPKMRPFWVACARKRFGAKYVDLTWNRVYGKSRGYEGKYYWEPGRDIREGSLLLDLDGSLGGVYLHQRVEDEEQRQLERGQSYFGPYVPRGDARIFAISEIRDELSEPLAHLDARIQVKTRTESKRRAWLGVEFVLMDAELAEQLKVETPTKDGQLGFLVSAVYPSSPAEKLGIQVGDILLRIQAPRRPYPVELSRELAVGPGARYDFGARWRPGGPEEMGPAEASWKQRDNGLTRALDAIGVGERVKITFHRMGEEGAGKTETLEYVIEQAPPDFDSAPKWKNRKIGLTVKDLTYEIRTALRLGPSDPGVIVANVEDGSPMDTARIFANEVITRLDGQPLQSARQMRELIAGARQAGRDKVRLTVFRLGKTRFADLSINAYNAADDEGLEEGEPGPAPTTTTAPSAG